MDDDTVWCLRTTGCIDLVYLRGFDPPRITVDIGDAKFSRYSKNTEKGETPIPEF